MPDVADNKKPKGCWGKLLPILGMLVLLALIVGTLIGIGFISGLFESNLATHNKQSFENNLNTNLKPNNANEINNLPVNLQPTTQPYNKS
jgi:hypothetical protein